MFEPINPIAGSPGSFQAFKTLDGEKLAEEWRAAAPKVHAVTCTTCDGYGYRKDENVGCWTCFGLGRIE